MEADRDFTLRPNQQQKFRSSDGNALISAVQNEVLTGELYDAATAQNLSTRVAEEVRSRLKALHLEHYKYLVQVNLSEQRGQSAHIVAQCVWDSDCDAMCHSFFSNLIFSEGTRGQGENVALIQGSHSPETTKMIDFYVTTTYALFSLTVYTLICYQLIKRRSIFKGSYYQMFIVSSGVNCFTYLNSLVILRMPLQTCESCLFSFFFSIKYFWGLEFFNCMYGHMAYVQYLMIMSFVLNRFTVIAFPLKYNYIWKILLIPLMLFNIFGPFILTHKAFSANPSYDLTEGDYYQVTTTNDDPLAQAYIVVAMITLTIISTFLTLATLFAYSQYRRDDRSAQWKLFVYSAIYFLVQLCATLCLIAWIWPTPEKLRWINTVGLMSLPYVSDALTFTPPYILIYCSPTMQKLLRNMLRSVILRKKVSIVTSIKVTKVTSTK